jgi:hypothetical protein
MTKIFSHSTTASAPATSGVGSAPSPASANVPATSASPAPSAPSPSASGQRSAAAPAMPAAAAAPASPVDVAAVLDKLAAKNSEKLDWKHSIVDLMKLVGMESSLSARKELAHDLHYNGDMNDSATMNIWLHKEVMQKLAANGANVPQDLLNK